MLFHSTPTALRSDQEPETRRTQELFLLAHCALAPVPKTARRSSTLSRGDLLFYDDLAALASLVDTSQHSAATSTHSLQCSLLPDPMPMASPVPPATRALRYL